MAACSVIFPSAGRRRERGVDTLLGEPAMDRPLCSGRDEGHLSLWAPSP